MATDGVGSVNTAAPPFEPIDLDDAVAGLIRRWTSGNVTLILDRPQPLLRSVPGLELISLRRLNRIVLLDVPNAAVIAEAGTTVGTIRETVGHQGLWCPALRWLPGDESIGAAVAGGHGRRTRKYGAVVDYLLGTRFVCPAVGLTRHGGMAIKNATGYNLTGAVAGSRGRLAVILEVILRLVPIPKSRSVRVFTSPRISPVWEAARSLALPTLDDPAKELVDRSLASVEAWATSLMSNPALAVEVEAGHAESDAAVVAAVELHAEAHGLVSLASFSWPPSEVPITFETRRLATDPATVAETSARLHAAAAENHVPMYVLGEMTGGALEVSVDNASRWPSGFDWSDKSHYQRSEVNQLRTALKSAFDPRGLLHDACRGGDSNE